MKINAVIKQTVAQEVTFPCIMQGLLTGMIVAFEKDKCGMILNGQDTTKSCRAHQHPLYYSTKWVMSGFVPFNGTIEVSNG